MHLDLIVDASIQLMGVVLELNTKKIMKKVQIVQFKAVWQLSLDVVEIRKQ